MGEIRNANPEQLEELANKLRAQGDGGAYGQLLEIFQDARKWDASAELASLQPLLTWLYDAAEQLRDSAALLRGDDPGSTMPGPYAPGAGAALDLITQLEAASWEVTGQDMADEFVELSEKDSLSHEELRWMNQILMDYGENPDFAGYLVDEMGMENYLRFSQRLDARAASDPDEAIMVTMLQGNLGTTLSSAFWTPGDMVNEVQTAPGYEDTAYQSWLQTPQGQRYQDRLDAFNAVGMEQLFYDEDGTYAASDDPDRRMGYDVAMDLFEQSHVPVDEKFFDQTMNHLMELERETPDIWHYARYRGDTADDVIPENDVVDRFLGIGAENPEAVATFFDPHVNGNLDYFLGDGESSRDIQPSPTETGQSPGLAAALEAAATGISPGTDPGGNDQGHSPANIRIAEEVWNTFATDRSRIEEGGGSEFLRPTLGVIAADYIADIQPAAQQLSRHEEAQFRTVGTGLLVAELARDQEAYELITAANNAYTDTRIEAAFVSNANDPDEIEHDAGRAAAQGGYLTGLMTDAYATAKYEDALEGDAGHNENVGRTKEYTDMLVDNIIARIPVAGGLIGEGASRISDFTFGQFEADSQVTAAQVSENEYEASRDACVVGSRRSGRAAFMEAGIEGVEWDDIRDEIEEQAGFGFDAGTTRDHPQ